MITVYFTCKKCGLTNRPALVRERYANEDVIAFTHAVAAQVKITHSVLSPVCSAREVDLKMPVTAAGRVGEEDEAHKAASRAERRERKRGR